jgi:hypothetical protein
MMLSTSFKWSASRVHRDDASAAQRAADAIGLVPHALVVLLRPENCLAIGQDDAHAFADRVRVFSRERENIGQEGFDALVRRAFRLAACEPRHAFRRGSGSEVQPETTNGCFRLAMD